MQKLIYCGLLLLAMGSASAQKIKKEALGHFNYLQPSVSNALDEAKFYFLDISISANDAYRRKMIERELSIEQFQMANADDPQDFVINIVEAPFQFGPSEKKTSTEKYKDGAVEKSRTIYYYQGTLKYHYTLKVLGKNEEELFRKIISGTEKTKGRSSTSQMDAHDYFIKDKLGYKDKAVKKCADAMSKAFNEYFVDTKKAVQVKLLTIDGKKFDFSEYQKSIQTMSDVYGELHASYEKSAEAEAKLKTCISYWEEFLKDATPEDKKSVKNAKVTAATYFNLGVAHFFNQDYAQALESFEESKRLDKGVIASITSWIYASKKSSGGA